MSAADSITDLVGAEGYLDGLINLEKNPGALRRRLSTQACETLLQRVGDPQKSFEVLHIAGSKGKGSTALFAEALLLRSGRRVGTFTSPHLLRWSERFRIDGSEVAESLLVETLEELRPHVDAARREAAAREVLEAPTFFDVTTALAFCLFRRAGVSHAVVEVGLGGRLDSTNVVEPGVCCITSIELEHTDRLGDTHEEIAAEKAGIIKAGVPVVLGPLPPGALRVSLERAAELDAPVVLYGKDFGVDPFPETPELFDGGDRIPFRSSLLGPHPAQNAALAWAAVRRLSGFELSSAGAVRALADTELPGRLELCGREPFLLVDGAHTPRSLEAALQVLEELPHRHRYLVLSLSSGKDIDELCRVITPGCRQVFLTRAEPSRSLPLDELERAVAPFLTREQIRSVADPERALAAAKEAASPEDLVCAVGSIYLAGIARKVYAAG